MTSGGVRYDKLRSWPLLLLGSNPSKNRTWWLPSRFTCLMLAFGWFQGMALNVRDMRFALPPLLP